MKGKTQKDPYIKCLLQMGHTENETSIKVYVEFDETKGGPEIIKNINQRSILAPLGIPGGTRGCPPGA